MIYKVYKNKPSKYVKDVNNVIFLTEKALYYYNILDNKYRFFFLKDISFNVDYNSTEFRFWSNDYEFIKEIDLTLTGHNVKYIIENFFPELLL
jgi:hypothetical protein